MTATIRQGTEQRSRRVESIRALAALGVVQYHTTLEAVVGRHHINDIEAHIAGWGISAIYVFFALSGYLIFRPFARRDYGGGGPVRLRAYALNRIVRLLPIYYVAILWLLITAAPAATGEQWWRFLLFSQSYSNGTLETIDPPTWTLVVELQFYLLLPFLAYAVARLTRRSAAGAAVVLGLIGAASFAYHATVMSPARLAHWQFAANFAFIIAGMLIGILETQWPRLRPERWPAWTISSTAWLVAGAALWPLTTIWSPGDAIALIASFLIVGGVILPLRPGRVARWLEWRPLATLGIATYSMYIWHVPLVRWLSARGVLPFRYEPDALIAMAICSAVALVSYRVIEAPFLRLRRRWAGNTLEAAVARADASR